MCGGQLLRVESFTAGGLSALQSPPIPRSHPGLNEIWLLFCARRSLISFFIFAPAAACDCGDRDHQDHLWQFGGHEIVGLFCR